MRYSWPLFRLVGVYRNQRHLIRKYDVSYFMASGDPLEDNVGFAEETKADFPLLSDPSKETAKAYGVLHMLGFANRHTFYIGADGTVLKSIRTYNQKPQPRIWRQPWGNWG